MRWQEKLFVVFWTAVTIIAIGIMVILYVSLIPHFHEIGNAATALLFLALICAGAVLVAFTYSFIGIALARRKHEHLMSQVITSGEVVAAIVEGNVIHLSAMHEAAKVPSALPAPKEEKPDNTPDEKTILELYDKGLSLRTIATSLGTTYHQVRKVTSHKSA